MGIFPTDIPIDDYNADRWHFQLNEPFNGHNVGALLENGKTVEPVNGRTLRRIAGGMGSMLIGAVRVEGGHLELGDCSTLLPPNAALAAADESDKAEAHAKEAAAAEDKAKADAEAAELAQFEADLAAEEAAKASRAALAAHDSTPAAVPALGSHPSQDHGAAAPSFFGKPSIKGKK